MGNSATTSPSKSSGSSDYTSLPSWAQTGSDAYNYMNSLLQTAPMNSAVQTLANGGMGSTTQDIMGQLASMGGSNAWMDQAAQMAQGAGSYKPGQITLPGSVSEQNWQSVYNKAGQPGAADQYLKSTAQGDYLNGSPYLDSIISKGAGDIATQTNQMFAAGGRYGSGANQGVIADSVGSMANDLRNQNYQAERDRQLNAANSLEAAQQGRLGLQSGAAGGVAGVQGQNIGNNLSVQGQNVSNNLAGQSLNLNAAGQLGSLGTSQFGQQLQSLLGAAGLENTGFQNVLGMMGQLPNIQDNKVFDAQQQMGVGSSFDSTAQSQLNDLINQWSQSDMQDWAALGGLLSAGLGSAGSYGTQTSTTTQDPNILGALGALFSAFA